jgi:hypothetical protein
MGLRNADWECGLAGAASTRNAGGRGVSSLYRKVPMGTKQPRPVRRGCGETEVFENCVIRSSEGGLEFDLVG